MNEKEENIMPSKKVTIVAHFCDYANENTNNRFNYLASMLYRKGYDVELITSSFCHRDKKQRTECVDGFQTYKTTLLYEPSYKKNVSLRRLFVSHKVLARNLKSYLEKNEKPDLIYCAFPSIDVAKITSEYATNNTIPFIVDIQDLWPEAFQMAFNVPIISNMIFKPMNKAADSIYSSANEIIAVSQAYVDRALAVAKRDVRGHAVYLGTDLQEFDEFAKKEYMGLPSKKKGEKWIAYCGTLGKSYDLISVIDALDMLKREAPKLVVMGDGPRRKEFEDYARKKQVSCIFTGKLVYAEMCSLLKQCDMTVYPIVGDSVASIINKHADYAASGLPVINTQQSSEYCQLVINFNMGVNCINGDSNDIALKIRQILSDEALANAMGKNARKCAEEKFNRMYTYREIVKVIEEYL